MAKMTASTSVPKSMQATYEAITALTDAFCRDHLNEDYRELARRMTAALCRKRPSPLASGQPRTWACGTGLTHEGLRSYAWADFEEAVAPGPC